MPLSKEEIAEELAEVEEEQELEAKILFLLSIYPVISPTMLQGGIGPSVKPEYWRPILRGLIQDGRITEVTESLTTPAGRANRYTKLSLPGTTISVSE